MQRKAEYQRDSAEAKKRVAGWRKRNPEYNRQYAIEHAAEIRTQHRDYLKGWYARNREARIAYSKQWRIDNPEKAKRLATEAKVRRRARAANAPGRFSYDKWMERVHYHGWRCRYCQTRLDANTLTLDHYKPLSRGGSNWLANLVPACSPCNLSKRATYVRPSEARSVNG